MPIFIPFDPDMKKGNRAKEFISTSGHPEFWETERHWIDNCVQGYRLRKKSIHFQQQAVRSVPCYQMIAPRKRALHKSGQTK